MLELGLEAALDHLGIPSRVLAYAEREASAAATLLARMEEEALASAPIWCGDLAELNAYRFFGRVDCVTAGFPCQPHSVAGKRAGLSDERWVWPDIVGILRACQSPFAFLENVPGLLSTGGLERVLFDLARLGFDAKWGSVTAAEVGASHERERIFILAYRHGARLRAKRGGAGQPGREPAPGCVDGVGEPEGLRRRQGIECCGGERDGREGDPEWAGLDLGHAHLNGCEGVEDAHAARPVDVGGRENLAHAGRGSEPWQEPIAQPERFRSPDDIDTGAGVADPGSARRQGRELGRARNGNRGWQEAHGSVTELCGLFAPGPADPDWSDLLEQCPQLAPAVEPGFRVLVDGLALVVDENRADALRITGNGVVPLQAAIAAVVLFQRAGVIE